MLFFGPLKLEVNMKEIDLGESSFELWAREVYFECPELIDFWIQSSDPFTKAKALLIMKYVGEGKHES